MDVDTTTPEFLKALEDAVATKVAEETEGLRLNRDEVLKEKKSLAAKLGKYKDIDPEKYAALVAMQEEAERKAAEESGNFEALEKQLKEQHAKELDTEKSKGEKLTRSLENYLVRAAATKAIADAEGAVDLLLPHVIDRLRVMENDDGHFARVVDATGQPVLEDAAKGIPMTIDTLVTGEMKEKFPSAFKGTGASGGGTPLTGSGGAATGTVDQNDPVAMGKVLKEIADGSIVPV